jgi:hypothetical protein
MVRRPFNPALHPSKSRGPRLPHNGGPRRLQLASPCFDRREVYGHVLVSRSDKLQELLTQVPDLEALDKRSLLLAAAKDLAQRLRLAQLPRLLQPRPGARSMLQKLNRPDDNPVPRSADPRFPCRHG